MSPPDKKGLSANQRVVVVTTTDARGIRRYVQTSNGELISYGQYLSTMMDREEERERKATRRREEQQLNRWAQLYRAHRAINGGNWQWERSTPKESVDVGALAVGRTLPEFLRVLYSATHRLRRCEARILVTF